MKKTVILLSLLFALFLTLSAQTSTKLSGLIIGSSNNANEKANVFDGNVNSAHSAGKPSGGWVGLDLGVGKKYVITKVGYCPRNNQPTSRVLLAVFEGANNPDFGDAITLFFVPSSSPHNVITYGNVNVSRGFRYVRYLGTNDTWCDIAELEFYGYESEGDNTQFEQVTNIPDVIIHTTNAQGINDRTNYIQGIVSFISADGTEIYTDSLGIRGRGNGSWTFDKKPYRIKLKTSASVLGHPAKGRSWTLISNEGDKTLMRNLLAFDLSRRLEMPYTPAGRPVNLFLNGEYKGCYQLCDHIDVRKNRVDIKEMKITDTSGENLTGGYFIEIDAYAHEETGWFDSQRNKMPVTIKSPERENITTEQRNYIISHFNTMEASVFAANYADPNNGFRKYIDVQTFVRHFLIGEFSGNTDTYWSVFLYKHRSDNKFYFCPVWDFDLAYENDQRTYKVNDKTDWVYKSGGSAANGVKSFIDRLLSDVTLYQEIKDTYAFYRDNGIITEEKLLETVDNYAAEMYDSQELNFTRWNYRNEWRHQMWGRSETYEGDVNIVKDYIAKRIEWMDKKLNYVPAPPEPPTTIDKTELDNVLFWSDMNGVIINNLPDNVEITICDISGRLISNIKTSNEYRSNLQKGVYIIRINSQKGESKNFKWVVRDVTDR